MPTDPAKPAFLSRRRLLRTLAAGVVAGAGTVGYTLGVEPHWYEVVERPMPLAGLPDVLVGKRVVQLSDLHAGRTDVDYLVAAMRRANELRPDLVLMTGDFIDEESPGATRELAQVVGALRVPPLGAFGCLGNHDYGHAWSRDAVADGVVAALERAGVRTLRNASVELAGLTLAGIDDLWSPHYSPWGVTARLDGARGAIVMCHNPDAVDFPDHWGRFRGHVLSGHTHGGQCKPPWLPPPLLPVENRRYAAGTYDVGPGRTLYVNRGIGHSLRARFNCRPEITCFTLARA